MWVKTILVLLGLAAFAAADDVISGGTLVNDMLSGIDVAVNPEDDENLSQKLANGGSEKATTIFTSQLPEDSTALENDIQTDNHFGGVKKALFHSHNPHSHTPHRHHPHSHNPHRHTPHRPHKHRQTRAPTRRTLTRAQKNDPCPNYISDKNTQEEDDKKCNDWATNFDKFPPKGRCGGDHESWMRKHCKKACGWCDSAEDELSMVSKAAVAARHKHHWHHRHHPSRSPTRPKPKWGKKHVHVPHRHRPQVHAPKAGQDEDLEWGKWGKDKKAAGAKKFAELKAAAPKKFAELKAAVEKAAAAKKGSNQDEDLEDEPNMERAAKKKGLDAIKKVFAWGKNKKAAGAKKLAEGAKKFAELKAAAPKKFAELKAAVEKAAAAKKG